MPYITKKEIRQKYQQNYKTFYSIYATKQTILLSVDGLNVYCISKVLFNLAPPKIQNKNKTK